MVTVLPARGQAAGRGRGDPPVAQGSSWQSLSRALGRELIPSILGCRDGQQSSPRSSSDIHGGMSEPGQAGCTQGNLSYQTSSLGIV